jgi:protein-S-isoprenylcysteine O-methyltransferase Ste14
MRMRAAAVGTMIFLVLVPGMAAGVIPWLLTDWRGREPPWHPAIRLVGLTLLAIGAVILASAFIRFVTEGRGTPAPVAPTERLVVGGLYRHVRNPMYLAVTATIVGQAMVLGRLELLTYAALFLATTAAFVHLYEEPTLLRRYGTEYEAYRRAVPGWWPRWHAWEPGMDQREG